MEDSKKTTESSKQMKDVCKVNVQEAIEAAHKSALERFDVQIDQQKAEISEREQKIASAEAEIAANDAEIARITFQNESETDKFEKRSNEVEIARLNATNKHLRHDIEEYRDAIKMYEGHIASTESKKAEYIKEYEALKAEQLVATSTEITVGDDGTIEESVEETTESQIDSEAEANIGEPAEKTETPNPATNDTLLEVRGAVFTNSQYTYSDMIGYLEEIAEYDAGVDQIDVCYEDDEMVDEFRDEYTPDKFVVGFEGRLLTSTFNQLQSRLQSSFRGFEIRRRAC